jgi:hypothetical protein
MATPAQKRQDRSTRPSRGRPSATPPLYSIGQRAAVFTAS